MARPNLNSCLICLTHGSWAHAFVRRVIQSVDKVWAGAKLYLQRCQRATSCWPSPEADLAPSSLPCVVLHRVSDAPFCVLQAGVAASAASAGAAAAAAAKAVQSGDSTAAGAAAAVVRLMHTPLLSLALCRISPLPKHYPDHCQSGSKICQSSLLTSPHTCKQQASVPIEMLPNASD